ncbi:Conserved_hypothetical protein [Hexamita inflata]|uniref:Uncharacterized protein n=1 Tax=Hexamita inflata TaxID=28002 RepID=A0AA86P4G6_9EUKA|nr:Conserved hypothetical protein [Hexamita inflata]
MNNENISAEPNNEQQLSEYDQSMILQFEDMISDGVLEIEDNQELTNLNFIRNFNVSKLSLYSCKNIEQCITNDTIKELNINKCGFQKVLGINLNNLEVLRLQENNMDDTQNILRQIQNNPQFLKLRELDLSQHLMIDRRNNDPEMSGEHVVKQINTQKSLNNLVKLTLDGNGITTLDILSALTNLEELDLSRNRGIDISQIKHLTKLTKLTLESCELMEIEDLSQLTSLTELNLNGNQKVDITPLCNLKQLVHLDLYFCGLKDISALQNLTKLIFLQLQVNQTIDISLLSSLNNLKELYISCNNIDDINPLYQLVKLTILNISYSKVKDFSVLRKLTNLEVLNMSFNSNADITPLQYLVKLRKLELWHCNLYDIYALRPLINLQKLILSNNYIHDISPLSSLNNLIELYLNENIITDFSSVKQHINLHQFQIEDQIKDQYMPTIKEQKIYKKIQIIDTSTILLRNTSRQRKQITARVNHMKEQISQCLLNLNNNHLQFSRNVISIFQQLDTGESCQ